MNDKAPSDSEMAEQKIEKAEKQQHKDIQTRQNVIIHFRKDNAQAAMQVSSSGPPIWLISFTDVIALMLTFFVLLYSMTSPDPEKWDRKIGMTPQASANFSGARNFAGQDEGVNLSRLSYNPGENLDYLEAVLEEVLTDRDRQFIGITRQSQSVHIHFDAEAIGTQQFNQFINRLTPTLGAMNNQLSLVGDDTDQKIFPTLQNVARLIRGHGYDRHMVLEVGTVDNKGGTGVILSVQADDGRRITR